MKLTKTFMATILLVAIAVASVTGIVHYTTPDAVAATMYYGDIDENGVVSVADARLALRYAIRLDYPNISQRIRGDWNGDDDVTAEDARMILRCAIGLEGTKELPETGETVGDKYYFNGVEVMSYDILPEGREYTVVHPDGTQETLVKPRITPRIPYDGKCDYCEKNEADVDGEYACAYGGCTRWMFDKTCPYCGDFVKAGTCHTCNNGVRYYNGSEYVPWDEIARGSIYTIVLKDGTRIEQSRCRCKYCGKDNSKWACTHGGCSRWMDDVTCIKCGAAVKAYTCHTCSK